MRVVEACAAWDRYLVPIYHVQAMQDLLAKDQPGCCSRASCERKESPQEEEDRQTAQKDAALETTGDGGGGTLQPVELVVINTEATIDG